MTLRTLIADDEPLARALLANWVRQNPYLRLVAEATDGQEAIDLVERCRVDLLLLDIQMPGLDGMETVRALRTRRLNPYIIFVTAWSQHAVSAFDLAAGDYLVKPVRKARFIAAIKRAHNVMQQRAAASARNQTHAPLLVRDGDSTAAIPPTRILWVEAASQYARIHTVNGTYLLSRPLADVASELPDPPFMRVHRSALVNIERVQQFSRHQGRWKLQLNDGAEVAVSRSRHKEVLARVGQNDTPASR